jgi:hypothetical protein
MALQNENKTFFKNIFLRINQTAYNLVSRKINLKLKIVLFPIFNSFQVFYQLKYYVRLLPVN